MKMEEDTIANLGFTSENLKRRISLVGFIPSTTNNELFTNNNLADFRKNKKPQCLAVFVATIGSFGLGNVLGWPAPALDDLRQRQVFGVLETTQSSWMASLALLGALFAGFISGVFINRFGRKMTMLLNVLPFLLGWTLVAFANNFIMIYVGRFVTGYAGGTFTMTVPIYVSEITEDCLRGVLGSLMVLMLVIGMLFSFACGTLLTWNQLSIASGFVPIILFLGLLFIPESPRFLLIKGNVIEARRALAWLHGNRGNKVELENQIDKEFSMLKISVETEMNTKTMNNNSNKSNIFTKPIMKPTIVCMTLMFFQQFGGINGIISYIVEIFREAGPNINANVASMILAVIQVVIVITSMLLVDQIGRKLLLISSAFIMVLSLTALGAFFYIKDVENGGEAPSNLSWLPFVSIVSYVIAYSGGMGPVPWLLTMELLNPAEKGITTSCVTMTYWLLAFISTKTFEDIGNTEMIGWHGCYWTFASITLIGIFFMYFAIPETKGKSSKEIQEYFVSEKTTKSNYNSSGPYEIRSMEEFDENWPISTS